MAGLCDLPARGGLRKVARRRAGKLSPGLRRRRQHRGGGLRGEDAHRGWTLDALFNNGAFACPGAVEDLPRGALREIFEVNLFGYHDLARQVISMMRAQGHGRIVNCLLVLGLVGMTWRGAYVATKFAMEGLSDVMRIEIRGHRDRRDPDRARSDCHEIRENAIPHFEQWIDWNSVRREQYASLRGRLYDKKTRKDAFELGPRR